MTKRIGPWRIHEIRREYENPWVKVDHHDVTRPDGQSGVYGVIRFAHLAIGVLPLFEDGTTMLVGQHRFPFDAYSWELPEGGCPGGEAPAETARRELAEETGITAANLVSLGEAQLSNSVTDEYAHYFIAWDLEVGEAAPEPDEVLDRRRVPLGDVLREIHEGQITDALTIMMVQGAVVKAQIGLLPERPQDIILSQLDGVSRSRRR
ncbi:MAG: NUDIX hydrolase [Pseudomonadota bacterium]